MCCNDEGVQNKLKKLVTQLECLERQTTSLEVISSQAKTSVCCPKPLDELEFKKYGEFYCNYVPRKKQQTGTAPCHAVYPHCPNFETSKCTCCPKTAGEMYREKWDKLKHSYMKDLICKHKCVPVGTCEQCSKKIKAPCKHEPSNFPHKIPLSIGLPPGMCFPSPGMCCPPPSSPSRPCQPNPCFHTKPAPCVTPCLITAQDQIPCPPLPCIQTTNCQQPCLQSPCINTTISCNPLASCRQACPNFGVDEDETFIESTLPYIKCLSAEKKMLFRVHVQDLLFRQMYANEDEKKEADKNDNCYIPTKPIQCQDEDELFYYGLIPFFKELNATQKLNFRLRFIEKLHKTMYSNDTTINRTKQLSVFSFIILFKHF